MTNSELTAYNYGRRLAQSAQEAVKGGQGHLPPPACIMTAEETQSLQRLGQPRWTELVIKGGNDVLGEPDAVPPLQA